MKGTHTVEKIGGTSMSRFGEIMDNVIIGRRAAGDLYGRIFVVSAYGGLTDALLENKKTGEPGVYGRFAAGDPTWRKTLEDVRALMIKHNRGFADIGLDQQKADAFVNERIDGLFTCLDALESVRSFGHMQHGDYLPASREFLSAQGEAHSAFNSVLILNARGVNARFVDLTEWKQTAVLPLDEEIRRAFEDVDAETSLPIVTGYVKCREGIMNRFGRGYSEITFSKIAVITHAAEGIIHKEFHLSTGDPKVVGVDKVRVIGNTNFDIADQMSDMDMEAIHAKASKEMEMRDIPIRVKNAFDPDHPGTLISRGYIAEQPTVEIICGRTDLVAFEVFDPEMVGQPGYDYKLVQALNEFDISYIAKSTNANTIAHFIPEKSGGLDACVARIRELVPEAQIRLEKVAIVSVLGSNMKSPGWLALAAGALAEAKVNVLALDQSMRQVNMQFVIEREQFDTAQRALHARFIEVR